MQYRKLILLFCLMSGLSIAQFTKDIEISSYSDDNLYRAPEPEKDWLTDASIQLNYQFPNTHFNIYYQGNLFIYQDYAARDFSLNAIGLNHHVSFGKEDKQKFYFGADAKFRLNDSDYNIYDYSQIYAYSNFRFNLDFMFIKTGYHFRYRDYSNISDLSNQRHSFFVQANKSFPTKTTLILETNIGHKSFEGTRIITSTTSVSQGGNGKGKGKMSGNDNQDVTTTSVLEIPSLSQAVVLTRITQSLHNNIGLYIQYRRQFSLTNETDFRNSDGYYQDEELFDDPFSYESESYSTQLTWMLPWSMKVQIGGAVTSKNYISDEAFISSQDSVASGGTRLDDYKRIHLNFTKIFFINKNWLKSLHIMLYYNYIDNESNSYWYDYKNTISGGGVKWSF